MSWGCRSKRACGTPPDAGDDLVGLSLGLARAGLAEPEVPDRGTALRRAGTKIGDRDAVTGLGGPRPLSQFLPELRHQRVEALGPGQVPGGGDVPGGVPRGGEDAVRVRGHREPRAGERPVQQAQPAVFPGGGPLHLHQDPGADRGVAEGPAVGVPLPDRLVKLLLQSGGLVRPPGDDLHRGEQARIPGRVRHQRDDRIVAQYPDRQPQVQQGRPAADRVLPDPRSRRGGMQQQVPSPGAGPIPVSPAGAGAQLNAVVRGDAEGPGLGVVHRRGPQGRLDHVIDAVRIGERLQHDLTLTGSPAGPVPVKPRIRYVRPECGR